MATFETIMPFSSRYEWFTGIYGHGTIGLNRKSGCRVFREKEAFPKTRLVKVVYMEKIRRP